MANPTPSSGYQSNTSGTSTRQSKVANSPDGYVKKAVPALKQKMAKKAPEAVVGAIRPPYTGKDTIPGKTDVYTAGDYT